MPLESFCVEVVERFDVVYDTAATMTTAVGLSLLRKDGVFLDIDPSPGKFIRSIFNRRLKPNYLYTKVGHPRWPCSCRQGRKTSTPVAEIVPLSEAIRLVTALEEGRKLGGKALVVMD